MKNKIETNGVRVATFLYNLEQLHVTQPELELLAHLHVAPAAWQYFILFHINNKIFIFICTKTHSKCIRYIHIYSYTCVLVPFYMFACIYILKCSNFYKLFNFLLYYYNILLLLLFLLCCALFFNKLHVCVFKSMVFISFKINMYVCMYVALYLVSFEIYSVCIFFLLLFGCDKHEKIV